MQNVLKRKNIFGRIFEFSPSKSYVLYHSESIDMNIEKLLKTHNFLLVSAKKTVFAVRTRRGVRKLRTCPKLLGFFDI